jgi:hypothetical protein
MIQQPGLPRTLGTTTKKTRRRNVIFELPFMEQGDRAKHGTELLLYLQDRLPRLLETARRLDQAGCKVSLVLTGFKVEPPDDRPSEGDDEIERLVALAEVTGEISDFPSRTVEEVGEALSEFFDRLWYERKLEFLEEAARVRRTPTEVLLNTLMAMSEVKQRYGPENLVVADEFTWGLINGKLSALRWVLGYEWDCLDT